MKISLKGFLAMVMVCTIISCKKHPQEEPVVDVGKRPTPVAHGTLIDGTLTQQTIGAAGGVMEGSNGTIVVKIPAGAVDAETQFSIQEVTSTIGANGLGKSYRLLPENVKFKQDVEISFRYNDEMLMGKFEDLLFMAYQDAKGYWRVPKENVLDKTTKTLKVKTRHFSDWSGYCSESIMASKSKLAANEEAVVTASYYFTTSDPDGPTLDDLLGENKKVVDDNIDEWTVVAGQGTITPKAGATAIFKAPASITEFSESKIQLRFKNIRDPRNGKEGLVLAYTNVKLVPNEYVAWELDGNNNETKTISARYSTGVNPSIVFLAKTSQNGTILVFETNGITIGTYPFGYISEKGKASITAIDWINGGTYTGFPCTSRPAMIGYVEIEAITDYIEGTIFGTVENTPYSGCFDIGKRKPISASFRVKKP